MGASAVDAFLRGHLGAWIGLFAAVIATAAIALSQRSARATPGRVLGLAALVSALSVGGILVAMALSVPRIVWRRIPPPAYATAAGDAWRTLRGPSTVVVVQGRPELALAGTDATGRVRLFGLFSGAPLEGYPDALPAAPVPGRPRICPVGTDECRAWPATWPEPVALSGGDFVWTRDLTAGAMAYDVESGLFLHHVEGLRYAAPVAAAGTATPLPGPVRHSADMSGAWALEQAGKLANEPSKDGPTALFVVRRMAGDRLEAMRVVAAPAGESFSYSYERASVSLAAGPAALAWFARPLLLLLVLWFPAVTLLLQAAPAWWASQRRKRIEAGEPVSEMPVTPQEFAGRARTEMAQRLLGVGVLAIGLVVAAPAVVAVVSLLAGR